MARSLRRNEEAFRALDRLEGRVNRHFAPARFEMAERMVKLDSRSRVDEELMVDKWARKMRLPRTRLPSPVKVNLGDRDMVSRAVSFSRKYYQELQEKIFWDVLERKDDTPRLHQWFSADGFRSRMVHQRDADDSSDEYSDYSDTSATGTGHDEDDRNSFGIMVDRITPLQSARTSDRLQTPSSKRRAHTSHAGRRGTKDVTFADGVTRRRRRVTMLSRMSSLGESTTRLMEEELRERVQRVEQYVASQVDPKTRSPRASSSLRRSPQNDSRDKQYCSRSVRIDGDGFLSPRPASRSRKSITARTPRSPTSRLKPRA